MRVLVAEDNTINQIVIRSMLEKLDCSVTLVPDGAAALSAIAEASFDAILMDYHMPVMDGLEATRRVREQGITVPIIALTASALHEDRLACTEAGMDGYLTKPVNLEALHNVLQTAVTDSLDRGAHNL